MTKSKSTPVKNWFYKQSAAAQAAYIKEFPGSKYAKEAADQLVSDTVSREPGAWFHEMSTTAKHSYAALHPKSQIAIDWLVSLSTENTEAAINALLEDKTDVLWSERKKEGFGTMEWLVDQTIEKQTAFLKEQRELRRLIREQHELEARIDVMKTWPSEFDTLMRSILEGVET